MTRVSARIAGAPISWGVCEVPGWGLELPPDRVLSEMASLGLRATELGPTGYLPTDPGALRDLLDAYGLQLVGGFVPLVLHDRTVRKESMARASASARTLGAAGAEVFVSSVVVDLDWSARVELDDEAWGHLLDGLAELDRLTADYGLIHALHPHVGTLVERADEVRRVLAKSDVGWCLDSGHLYLGGFDPVEFAVEAGERVRHVHLKDVDARVAAGFRSGGPGLVEAVQHRLFVPLGEGAARVDDTVTALETGGYDGWYVLEQDTALTGVEPPPGSGPVVDVRQCTRHLEQLVNKTARG